MTTFEELDALRRVSGSNAHKLMTQSDLDEAHALIIETVKSHPSWKEFAIREYPPKEITHPWQAIGHKLFASMLCLMGAQGKLPVLGTLPESNAHMMTMISGLLSDAAVYLWYPEIEKIANAAPLPKHILSRSILASPVM